MPIFRRRVGLLNLNDLEAKLPSPWGGLICPPLESLLCLDKLNALYETLPADRDILTFCDHMIEKLGITARVSDEDLARIPRTGPLVVVANHPFGAIEGVMLARILFSVRSDVRLLANYMLGRIPDIARICIMVDPFESADATRSNVRGITEAIRWLRNGGVLGVFPSGQVAHLQPGRRRITETAWNRNIAGLARRTGASVLPIYFEGGNSYAFQLAGLIHPRLRTAMIPREVFNTRSRPTAIHVGSPITPREIACFPEDQPLIDHLRLRTYLLAGRPSPGAESPRRWSLSLPWRHHSSQPTIAPPIAPPVAAHQLEHDIKHLPRQALLAENGDLQVFDASASHIPNVMIEVGRLREVTFRTVGEGTGRPLDLDRFDRWYRHLLVWNPVKRELVGAYRYGLIDRLLHFLGPRSLYVSTLFEFDERAFQLLGPTLELGRSFVRPEYQKSFAPLMMLWRGIGRILARRPQYRRMIGPVSISASYRPLSQAIMVSWLAHPDRRSPWASMVRPTNRFIMPREATPDLLESVGRLREVDQLSDAVSDIEPTQLGVPILLKQYLRLGARALTFNVDPTFTNCLDCLCLFDILEADQRTIRRYMGEESAARFYGWHGVALPATGRDEAKAARRRPADL